MTSTSVDTIKKIKVSGSQIDTYNRCGKLHEYTYTMSLEPAIGFVNLARYRGNKGHESLAVYYQALLEGEPRDVARKLALDYLRSEAKKVDQSIINYFDLIKVILGLIPMLERYFDHYVEEPFKIISVEREFSVDFDDTVEYLMITDLLVEWTKGEWRGEPVIIDHKFVHDFKSEGQLKMDGQQPKYVKAVRENGYRAKRAVFNQIRTRDIKNPRHQDLFRRSPLKQTLPEINAVWEEHKETALEIAYDPKKPRRIMQESICKYCVFKDLCHLELTGIDSSNFIQSNFVKRKSPTDKVSG